MFEALVAVVIVVLVLAVGAIWSRLGSLEQRLDRLEPAGTNPSPQPATNPSPQPAANPSPQPAASPSVATSLSPIEVALLQGRKIEAIDIYRKQTGASLKESKDAVEQMAQRLHIREL